MSRTVPSAATRHRDRAIKAPFHHGAGESRDFRIVLGLVDGRLDPLGRLLGGRGQVGPQPRRELDRHRLASPPCGPATVGQGPVGGGAQVGCTAHLGQANQIGLLTGSVMPAQAYYKAQKLRELVRRQVLEAMATYDVLILPTSKSCAPMLDDDPAITSKEMAAGLPPAMTRPFNLASAPALSVNCGFNSQGLPIGLQIGGRPFKEETVLKLGNVYEQNTSWHTRRPPNA